MVLTAVEPPSRAEGSGSFTVASYNIRSGRNGGLESALRAMKLKGVDCGVFLETKLTNDIYMPRSSSYNVRSTRALSKWQGGISLFWRASDLYEVEEVELRGPAHKSRLLVSRASVHGGQVYTIDGENRLRKLPVEIDFVQERDAIVRGGLKAGMKVITTDLVPAVEGMLLAPQADVATR